MSETRESRERKNSGTSEDQEEESNSFRRICFFGGEGCGKTALITRFLNNTFDSTSNVSSIWTTKMKKVQVDGKLIPLEILDTGGNDQLFRSKLSEWSEWGEAFAMCFAIDSPVSFHTASARLQQLLRIKKESFPLILIGTKADLESKRQVSVEQAKNLARTFEGEYIETSSESGLNVEEAFILLVHELSNVLATERPPERIVKQRSSSLDSKDPRKPAEMSSNFSMESFEDVELRDSEKVKRKSSKKESKDPKEKEKRGSTLAKGTLRKLGKTFSNMKKSKSKFGSVSKSMDGYDEQLNDFWCSKDYTSKDWKEFEDVEESNQMVSTNCRKEGFHIESGVAEAAPVLLIDGADEDISFYEHFFSSEHTHFFSDPDDETCGPVCISVEKPSKEATDWKKVIYRTKKGNDRFLIPASSCVSLSEMIKYIKSIQPELANTKLYEVSTTPELRNALIKYERQDIVTRYKFGLLYVKEKQTNENDMFSNTTTSPEFEEFLSFLGERIKLKGWDKFRGGLDVKTDTTGTNSLYTTLEHEWNPKTDNFEIMFHVSTMLPFYPDDEQQIERKRHIGNDIVVLVFKEGPTPFDPLCLTSHFNHVFVIVQYEKTEGGKTYYRASVANKDGVSPYGPVLPKPNVFEKNSHFRTFLLNKLINGEREAMRAPSFKQKMMRTRRELLKEIIDTHKNSSRNKSFSPMKENTLAEMKELSHFMSERGHVLKEKFKDKTANLRLRKSEVSTKESIAREKARAYESKIHECAKLVLVEYSEHNFNPFNFLTQLDLLAQSTVKDVSIVTEPQLKDTVNEQIRSVVSLGSYYLHLRMSFSGDQPPANMGEIGNKFVKLISLLLVSMQAMLRSYEALEEEAQEGANEEESGEPANLSKNPSKEVSKRKSKEEARRQVEKKPSIPEQAPSSPIATPSSPGMESQSSLISPDRESMGDSLSPQSQSILVNATRCAEEAEKLASQLVYLLTPNDLDTNELGEVLNGLGHISKEILSLASQSEIRSLLTRLTDSTRDMLAEGIELSNNDTPEKRNLLLTHTNHLLNVIKEIAVEQELNSILSDNEMASQTLQKELSKY